MTNSIVKKIRDGSCGPGGIHCRCCRPGRSGRRAFNRGVRRRIAREGRRFDAIAWGVHDREAA